MRSRGVRQGRARPHPGADDRARRSTCPRCCSAWPAATRHGYTFAVPSGPGRTLLGASPELLVSRHGDRLTANPLAGSTPRAADLAEDVRRAAALLESAKDLHEHAVVVDAVREALAPFCADLEVPERPTLVRTAAMWHLSTTVTGELADPATSALELACALHPTPAVCGTPTDLARAVIGELEPFDRGHYTGMVGWSDANGDGEWVVTIRCAEAEGRTAAAVRGGGRRRRLLARGRDWPRRARSSVRSCTPWESTGDRSSAGVDAPHLARGVRRSATARPATGAARPSAACCASGPPRHPRPRSRSSTRRRRRLDVRRTRRAGRPVGRRVRGARHPRGRPGGRPAARTSPSSSR